MERQKNNFFWQSYVDLLTALFAVVLVLFILSFKLFKDNAAKLKKERDQYAVFAKEYERIQKITKQIQALENTGVFKYDSVYNRFLVRDFIGQEIFVSYSASIKPEYYATAKNAGQTLVKLIDSLYNSQRIRFLVLIEGNAAKPLNGHKSDGNDIQFTYELSYKRALALKSFWLLQGIIFDPQKCELIVSGSGFYGIGRDAVEENNKRFIIQIIPKIDK